jgi:hypothetical protein
VRQLDILRQTVFYATPNFQESQDPEPEFHYFSLPLRSGILLGMSVECELLDNAGTWSQPRRSEREDLVNSSKINNKPSSPAWKKKTLDGLSSSG